jgi:hypothetical protein
MGDGQSKAERKLWELWELWELGGSSSKRRTSVWFTRTWVRVSSVSQHLKIRRVEMVCSEAEERLEEGCPPLDTQSVTTKEFGGERERTDTLLVYSLRFL